MERLRRVWPILFLLFLPLLVLSRAVFLGQTIGAFDQIRQMSPWNGPEPPEPWDVLQADAVLQFYPWRDLVLDSWGQLRPPFWNPYQLAGTPLLANSQSAGFYPPHIVLGVLHVPTPLAITLLAWLHLFWAGLGVLLLVRKLGGTRIGGVVAGGSFSLSAFLLGWTPLSSVIYTVSWIPWALAFTASLFENDPRRGLRSFVGLAASVGMMILAGHLQFVAYGLFAVVVCAVGMAAAQPLRTKVDLVVLERRRSPIGAVGLVLASTVLGFLFAAPQLLPVLRYSEFSHRRNSPNEEGYRAYIGSAISPGDFVSRLVNPFSQGSPLVRVDPELPFSTFWPALAKPGANWAESTSTIGPLVLLLLCLLPLSRPDWRRAGGIVAVTILAALLAVGTPLNKLLYFYAPGWSSTGSPSRILCLFVLGACTLAGLSLNSSLSKAPRRSLALAGAAFVLVFALSLTPTRAPAPTGIDPNAWEGLVATGNTIGLPVAIVSALIAVLLVAASLQPDRRARFVPLAFLVVFPLLTFMSIVRTGDSGFLKPQQERGTERVAAINQAWGLTSAAHAVLPPNTASALRIHDLGGYDSLLHRDTVALLAEVVGGDPAPEANGNIMFIKPSADLARLAQAGVTKVLRNRLGDVTETTNLKSPGRLSLDNGTAWIVEEGLDRLSIEIDGNGRLVLRDRNLPGWTARIDGREVPIEGTVWREVEIPEGSQRLEMRYTPPGLVTGFWLFLLGAAFIGFAAFYARRLARRKPTQKGTDERRQMAA
ncbi:MAG TPA: hypothetical protein VGE01_14705 [Fimbriimonas sp.]